MKYEDMKVAELKDLAHRRGIDPVPKLKADIIAALTASDEEDGVVEAEVIEPQGKQLAVVSKAGTINANFDELEAWVDLTLSFYEGWEPSADNPEEVEQCAQHRKNLNGLAKEIDDKRKSVKRNYDAPLIEFESKCNAIRDRIKKVSERLQTVEKEARQAIDDAKYQELKEHYEAYVGMLADAVPYERVHEKKWLNLTCKVWKAKNELEEKADKIVSGWEALKNMNLEYFEEAELRYFETLDLNDAITYAAEKDRERKRVEEMKREMDQYRQPAPAEPVQPVNDLPQTPEIAEAQPVETPPQRASFMKPDPAKPRIMIIDAATTEQCKQIGKVCGSLGVTGRFVSGTLEEVYWSEQERKRNVG